MANMGIKEEVQELEKELQDEQKKPPEERSGLLDLVSSKLVSRKLLVWITGTALLWAGKLTPDQWVSITLGYVSVQGFADLVSKWKGGGEG